MQFFPATSPKKLTRRLALCLAVSVALAFPRVAVADADFTAWLQSLWPQAQALGVSRASLYAAIGEGTAPVQVIRVGHRMKVLTHSLLAVLEGGGSHAESA